MEYDSEFEKTKFAMNSKQKKTNGFEGCANYGKGCDFRGFYCYKYSKEGLCDDCERKIFPERYSGCGFCGYMLKYGGFCMGCKNGFQEWLFNLFYNKNKFSKSTSMILEIPGPNETDDWKLWQTVGNGIYVVISKSEAKFPVRIFQNNKFDSDWPGFYVGNNKHIRLDPFKLKSKINISDINWDNRDKIISRELQKLGICPFEDVQVDLSKVDEDWILV